VQEIIFLLIKLLWTAIISRYVGLSKEEVDINLSCRSELVQTCRSAGTASILICIAWFERHWTTCAAAQSVRLPKATITRLRQFFYILIQVPYPSFRYSSWSPAALWRSKDRTCRGCKFTQTTPSESSVMKLRSVWDGGWVVGVMAQRRSWNMAHQWCDQIMLEVKLLLTDFRGWRLLKQSGIWGMRPTKDNEKAILNRDRHMYIWGKVFKKFQNIHAKINCLVWFGNVDRVNRRCPNLSKPPQKANTETSFKTMTMIAVLKP
jgi:hypothetical protein